MQLNSMISYAYTTTRRALKSRQARQVLELPATILAVSLAVLLLHVTLVFKSEILF
ncbi:hypothetical protein EJ05DRAFT_380429 [Pseudovirgaria hyperparasitica]|uniref:Uncharacterized protein n=1 Tax=Pseudovirgaria hyperparasitica TaxID=470096 RepID=A0A6A6WAP5_9PEZI|nr:uncharacterized protein EJ05DRAFT_380429 [Pseudovirgaria hyperparasitica]KAF2758191.1 hypothetical protein EJ05DRAFT_380429 [Pseudovirgaria hyperparasitica]